MPRYFLQIAYKGTRYHGWQIQPNALSIQQLMNEKLSLQLDEEIYCIGCGRTDTGVHARKFFLHFDSARILDATMIGRLNPFLPSDIAVYRIYRSADDASARWDAVERTYTYIISIAKNPFLTEFAAFIHRPLNIKAMKEAATMLLKFEDFEALSKVNEQTKHHLCSIRYAVWKQLGDKLVFRITANRFLRGMVRVAVGSMLEVGKGKMTIDEFTQMIEEKDRTKAGSAAPAAGLYLSDVRYPAGLLHQL